MRLALQYGNNSWWRGDCKGQRETTSFVYDRLFFVFPHASVHHYFDVCLTSDNAQHELHHQSLINHSSAPSGVKVETKGIKPYEV